MKGKHLCGVYGILPPDVPDADLLSMAEAALRGRVRMLQLRDKRLSRMRIVERGRALAKLCHAYGALFILNDDVEAAIACGADGVHLGPTDCPDPAQLRRWSGRMIVGYSCKDDVDLAERALAAGASYVSIGAVFPTKSKADAHWIGLEPLRLARLRLKSARICAIGGVNMENLLELRRCGADLVAVLYALFGVKDVEKAARGLVEAWESAASR